MAQKQWFTVKSSEKAQVVYLVSAGNEADVQNIAYRMGQHSVVAQLTWQDISDLTGGIIPVGSNPHALASGNFMLPKRAKADIVLWPI